MRITEYPKVASLTDNDVLIADGADGTKTIEYNLFRNAMQDIAMTSDKLYQIYDDAGIDSTYRRNIYRGKYLGSSVTDKQWSEIGAGTFKGMFLGDYWGINDVIWRIVDFNYWFYTGRTACVNTHLVIMPDSPLYNAQMNETGTTFEGYVGSQMYRANITNAKTQANSAFGTGHILNHEEYLVNGVTNGCPHAGAWCISTVELPNEPMMYGSYVFTPATNGLNYVNRHSVSKTQLALFKAHPYFINPARSISWLRDVVSSEAFAIVDNATNPSYAGASGSHGVRPVFGIKAA